MKQAIHELFIKSWKLNKLPHEWKTAKVQFLKKHGKKDYHHAGSYRPISLTSCLGKLLEKIVERRIYAFVEHNKILDTEQEGFRKFRGTTNALLRLTQDIYNGYNKSQSTVGIFIDMEKAYDTVWRVGLLTKLKRFGIQGKIWFWLKDFLSERSAFCKMGSKEGNRFSTELDLPQGSVLSSTLFNLYLSDIYEDVKSSKVKFADDGTL